MEALEALGTWDGVAGRDRGRTRSRSLPGWQSWALRVTSKGGASSGSHFRKIFWSLGGEISWSKCLAQGESPAQWWPLCWGSYLP